MPEGPECTKFSFVWGSALDLSGETHAACPKPVLRLGLIHDRQREEMDSEIGRYTPPQTFSAQLRPLYTRALYKLLLWSSTLVARLCLCV